jgi:hypothetical protein
MNSSLRIVVTGMVGIFPVGGVAWDYLQYVIGLARLGHDVFYHEDTWSWPYHPLERTRTSDARYSASFIGRFFERFAPDLKDRWHYLHLHEQSHGMSRSAFRDVARTADLFLNVSGACMIPDGLSPRCVKVFLDTDPGYNQIMLSERFSWSENVERWCSGVADHDRFFTYGENIRQSDCLVPLVGLDWRTTRMPVVVDLWKLPEPPSLSSGGRWTTVMSWNEFPGPLVFRGVEYRSKGAEFEKLIDLPSRIDLPLRVAVGGAQAPLERLRSHGWEVVDGPQATRTPEDYRTFIARSRGEVSPAKHVYVALRTGWFSCRSACYLAAGRPVVVQDTGFSAHLPVGDGILPFDSAEAAEEACRRVEADPVHHARSAREVATTCFEASGVLQRFVEDAFRSDA